MKSSQLMARIEAAGWKRIHAVGSHFTYQHPDYGKALYPYGRPQTEVGKRNLREINARFHLVEIAKAIQKTREIENATRTLVSPVKVAPEVAPEAAPAPVKHGTRWGVPTHRDPWVNKARLALEAILVADGITAKELAQQIGIGAHVITNIRHHNPKTIWPANKAKIQVWMNGLKEHSEPSVISSWSVPNTTANSVVTVTSDDFDDPDSEMEAMFKVWKLVKEFDRETAHRILAYVSARIQERS